MRAAVIVGFVALGLGINTSSAYAQIAWQQDLIAAHAKAEREGKPILLHFFTNNCVACEMLERGAFLSPHVAQAINSRFIPLRVNANSNPKLCNQFGVNQFPCDVIVEASGRKLFHSVSPNDPSQYVAMLARVPLPVANPNVPSPAVVASNTPAATVPGVTPGGDQIVTGQTMMMPTQPNMAMPADQPPVPGTVQAQPGAPQPQMGMPPTEVGIQAPVMETPAGTAPKLDQQAQLAGARLEPSVPVVNPSPSVAEVPDPELAMQGFCPVSVIKEDRWVEGNPQFGVIHLGKLYLFFNQECMQEFLKNPTPYTPVLNGLDVVRFFEERKIVEGKREFGLKDPVHSRMFFFADEAAMNHFLIEHKKYSQDAIKIMDKAIKDSNPGT